MAIIEKDELYNLVPHKDKMFLLSRIIEYNESALTSEFDISDDCIFYDDAITGLPSWISFELMAQSVSALVGIGRRNLGKPPKPGFILSVSSMEFYLPVLKCGETARTLIVEDCRVDAVSTFACKTTINGKKVAEAKLTCVEVDDSGLVAKVF
ncbi:MAG: 3-hydroxylacyl-ACP dehydratase [Spirochaetaceae bacterium]|jgi:predicted hotdog family 3-hydroxylacyl-ACP dehydratase|nr:3-hydroxylacyl-ACP dehydratase [Spirochaetaceae bacterium]